MPGSGYRPYDFAVASPEGELRRTPRSIDPSQLGALPEATVEKPAPVEVASLPIYTPGQFGDSIVIPFILIANVPQLVLQRTKEQRVMLLIQNQNGAGNVFYAYDRVAAVANSIFIPPGGNRLYDSAVPQGNLWLIAPANSVVVIEYMNKNALKAIGAA
jgi:hypothetical protein